MKRLLVLLAAVGMAVALTPGVASAVDWQGQTSTINCPDSGICQEVWDGPSACAIDWDRQVKMQGRVTAPAYILGTFNDARFVGANNNEKWLIGLSSFNQNGKWDRFGPKIWMKGESYYLHGLSNFIYGMSGYSRQIRLKYSVCMFRGTPT